jgi:hypothetical protein
MSLPEIALVTLIKGECSAGATFQTTLYPTKPAKPKVKNWLMNAAPVSFPMPTELPIPAVTSATSLVAFCHGVKANVLAFSAALVGAGGEGTGAGMVRTTGAKIAPW